MPGTQDPGTHFKKFGPETGSNNEFVTARSVQLLLVRRDGMQVGAAECSRLQVATPISNFYSSVEARRVLLIFTPGGGFDP